MMPWGVAQIETFREAGAIRNLEREQFTVYLPLLKAGGKVCPLFPGYAFFGLNENWARIGRIPGVVRILKNGDGPARLSEELIAEIRAREQNGVVVLAQPRGIQPGDQVRITAGSLLDKVGLFAGLSGKQRAIVLLAMLGRQARVEVPAQHLQSLTG
jgi:transcriptional antiterminator RfaH